jgi:hypothetical protein
MPAALAAQATHQQAGALTGSIGIGSGSAAFSCDVCGSHRDVSVTVLGNIGARVRSNLVVVVEGSGWKSDYSASSGNGDASIIVADAALQWYPRAASGVFVKGGVGPAWVTDHVSIDALGETTVKSRSAALVVGAGWDVPITKLMAISPYAAFDYLGRAKQSVNGLRIGEKLGATVLQVGVAARFH